MLEQQALKQELWFCQREVRVNCSICPVSRSQSQYLIDLIMLSVEVLQKQEGERAAEKR